MSEKSKILTQLTEAVSKLTDNALSTTGMQAVAVKLPEFWTDDPEIWFLRAEAQFRSKSIIVDQTKFDYVITALDNHAAAEVKAVLLNPPKQGKYNALKTALLNAFGKFQLQKDAKLSFFRSTFLGMINFYHRFLPTIASRPALLHAASAGRDKELAWTTKCQDSFENVKAALAHATLLHHPQANAPTSITVDASDLAIKAQLEQLHHGYWKPIAFFSRKLSSTKMKYSTFDRELLAAYQAVHHFRHFVEGKPFTLYTDHKPLTFALSNNANSPRQSRHLSFIAEFTSDIRHVKRKFNVVADTLSRINTITLPPIDFRQLANDQAASQEIAAY